MIEKVCKMRKTKQIYNLIKYIQVHKNKGKSSTLKFQEKKEQFFSEIIDFKSKLLINNN